MGVDECVKGIIEILPEVEQNFKSGKYECAEDLLKGALFGGKYIMFRDRIASEVHSGGLFATCIDQFCNNLESRNYGLARAQFEMLKTVAPQTQLPMRED